MWSSSAALLYIADVVAGGWQRLGTARAGFRWLLLGLGLVLGLLGATLALRRMR